MTANSQTPRAAMMLAAKRSLMLNVTKTPRNATAALKAPPIATPLHSAPLLAVSPTVNVIQVQENARAVTQKPTKTAPKQRLHATKNAPSRHLQNVELMENAHHAQKEELVASQPLHVIPLANLIHLSESSGCAAGIQLFQNACKIHTVL